MFLSTGCRPSPRPAARGGAVARLIAVLLVMLASLGVRPACAQQMSFTHYAQERGLNNLGTICMAQDRSGFVLVCTESGVYAFDGRSFSPYGIDNGLPAEGLVYGLNVTPAGRIFVTFSDGVYVADPARGGTDIGPFRKAAVTDGPISVMLAHMTGLLGNDLLLIDKGGLMTVRTASDGVPRIVPFFDAATLKALPQLSDLRAVNVTADGIWLACGKGELCRVPCTDGRCGAPAVLGARDGLPAGIWTSVLRDRTGTLWARSMRHLAHLDPAAGHFVIESVPGPDGRYAGHDDRLVLVEDRAGRLYTQSAGGLLCREDGVWHERRPDQGVPEGQIVSILFDRDGSLWLGVRDQGLFYDNGIAHWENWTKAQGLADNVIWQLGRSGGGPLWFASEVGVSALRATMPPGAAPPLLPVSSWSLAITPTGRVWHGTIEGRLSRFDPATGRDELATQTQPVLSMLSGPAGLWLATKDGLLLMRDPDTASPPPPIRLPSLKGEVHAITGDGADGVWAADGTALYHVGGDGTVHPIADLGGTMTLNRAIAVGPDRTIWLGGLIGGIRKLRVEGDHVVASSRISAPTLASNTVLILYRDRRGWMWVGTDQGLDVWNGAAWSHLDEADGLSSDDLDESSVLDDSDGSIWFGTGHGISHLLDTSTLFDTPPLHPAITAVRIGGRPLRGSRINWSHEPLTIHFSALDFGLTSSIRFRYRLEGVDSDWVETTEGEARYPQLPPGRLHFSVQAIDPKRRRSSEPVSFDLTVRAPWWRTAPFEALCGLIVVGLVMSLWRLRIRFILRRQRQLEALVAMRTAQIEQANAALFEQATRDSLTGLMNRPAIMQAIEECMAEAAGQPTAQAALAIALVDLDHFKAINDTYGHFGGDSVLREISDRLRAALRPAERAGRYGGEELILLIPRCARPPERVEWLRQAMTALPVPIDGTSVLVTCSIGVAWRMPGDTPESILRRADQALYAAKNAGRDRVEIETGPEPRSRPG